jgi:hypothetical protein
MRYNIKGEEIDENSVYFQEHGTYYEAHYCCSTCEYKFSVVSEQNPKGKCPSCPKCKENSAKKGQNKTSGRLKTKKQLEETSKDMIASKKVAYLGGKSAAHKAHDATMNMVMEDYGLTDINDRPQEGENCVPKLPHHLEQQVNNGFGAGFGQIPKIAGNINPSVITSTGMGQINSGKFRDQGDIVADMQKHAPKPKYNYVN